jgi:hypothetical protein
MAITLQFGVKPGDTFEYHSTFTSERDGKPTSNSVRSAERVVALEGGNVHFVDPNDPENLVTVYDRRGFTADILQAGASIKNDMPGEMFDFSNRMIFPEGPVSPGDTWEARDGAIHVSYRLIGTATLKGREVAEVHATESSYTGPIKFWVEIATGRTLRQEYLVGDPVRGTTTVIERI